MRRPGYLIALIVFTAALVLPQAALAEAPWKPYDAKAFTQAQKDGKTIFVSVHSDW